MLRDPHQRSLGRAVDLYLADDLDACERALQALFADIGAPANARDRRTLGEGWECLARVEIDRGNHERAMRAFEQAEKALEVDRSNRELLGRVQYQLAAEFIDLPGFEAYTREYFKRARENLEGSKEYGMLVDRIDLGLTEDSAEVDWRVQRDRLSAELESLYARWDDIPKGQRGRGRREAIERRSWALTRTLTSLAVLKMEHGDDDEFREGLEMLLDAANLQAGAIGDVDGWLAGLMPLAAVLDRPAVELPPKCYEVLQAAERAAQSTGRAPDRAAVDFLWGIHEVKRGELTRGLSYALRALANATRVFALTRSVVLRSSQKAQLVQYQHLALTAARGLNDARLVGELIEAARPQTTPAPGGDPLRGDAPLGDASFIAVDGQSAMRSAFDWLGLPPQQTLPLEDAIAAVGGWDAWWWGSWFSMGEYFWAVRSPAGAWTCGHEYLEETAREALLLIADIYHREGPSPGRAELPLSHDDEMLIARALGQMFLPPPLLDALRIADDTMPLSLVVAGALPGMLPLPTLAVDPKDDVRLVERAVVRVQPPAVLVAAATENTSDPFGPWPLAVACLDPAGDLPHARHDIEADHLLVGEKLVDEQGPHSRAATGSALREALASTGRSAAALFFYSGHVLPGEQPGDLATRLFLARDDVSAADFYGVSGTPAMCAPARVLLSACDSGGTAGSGSGEWFGLSGGLFVAGARHVVATAWPILDTRFGNGFERELVDALETTPDAARALRDLHVEALESWRAVDPSDTHPHLLPTPAIFASYQSIGLLA